MDASQILSTARIEVTLIPQSAFQIYKVHGKNQYNNLPRTYPHLVTAFVAIFDRAGFRIYPGYSFDVYYPTAVCSGMGDRSGLSHP
jgi:hypothetical protein